MLGKDGKCGNSSRKDTKKDEAAETMAAAARRHGCNITRKLCDLNLFNEVPWRRFDMQVVPKLLGRTPLWSITVWRLAARPCFPPGPHSARGPRAQSWKRR